MSVSTNPTEGEKTFKVSLVSIVGSRPVRVINGDPVSEIQPFATLFKLSIFRQGFNKLPSLALNSLSSPDLEFVIFLL